MYRGIIFHKTEEGCKICNKLKLDNEEEDATKRVITKILKLHESNQYYRKANSY